jgi:enoyl-CoA hydratase/carnithine racemase
MKAGYTQLLLTRQGSVHHLVLNRPQRHNAQTPTMWDELSRAGAELAADPSVRVLVVRGSGPSFSSGIDLAELAPSGFIGRVAATSPPIRNGDPDPGVRMIREAQRAFSWIQHARFPVVAAVHGAAIGAGFQLALACDLRFVAANARLGLAEARLGVIPDLGATAVLPRLVGIERALDLMVTARELSGDQACREGLALRSVPEGELDAAASDYAAAVAALAPGVVEHIKKATAASDPERNLQLAALGQAECVRRRFGPHAQHDAAIRTAP